MEYAMISAVNPSCGHLHHMHESLGGTVKMYAGLHQNGAWQSRDFVPGKHETPRGFSRQDSESSQ